MSRAFAALGFAAALGIATALNPVMAANNPLTKAVEKTTPIVQEALSSKTVGVNINQASKEELAESLPGVGPVKAAAIVEYREKNGPFKSLDDLEKVKGIGPAFIKNHKDKIGF